MPFFILQFLVIISAKYAEFGILFTYLSIYY